MENENGYAQLERLSKSEWFESEVRPRLAGRCALVRYTDDAVMAFDNIVDAQRVLAVLGPRPRRRDRQALTGHRQGLCGVERCRRKHRTCCAKTRELIALAVAITLHCDGCIAVHTAAAKKLGATKEEIAEALGVGISVNAGAAIGYSSRTLDAFEAAA